MSWSHEIIRALFVAFGAMEFGANLYYLSGRERLALARKQHGELPVHIGQEKLKIKVICMMFAGIIFLISGLISFFLHRYTHELFIGAAALFAIYACVEALYYRYWKTAGFSIVAILFLLMVLFL